MYEFIGRLTVLGARTYLHQRFGNRPQLMAAAALVAGAVAAVLVAGRRQ